MSWKPSWILPPISEGKNIEMETYSNFLKDLSKEDLNTYEKLLPTQTNDPYGLALFKDLKAQIGGRRKKGTRAKKLKRKTRRNKLRQLH
jgi:hypothetical protein